MKHAQEKFGRTVFLGARISGPAPEKLCKDFSVSGPKVLSQSGSSLGRVVTRALSPRLWIGACALIVFQVARLFGDYRLGGISANRIGHFVSDVLIRSAEQSIGDSRGKYLFGLYPSTPISNHFWLGYAKKHLKIKKIAGPMVEVAQPFARHIKWYLPSPMTINGSRDPLSVVSRSGISIGFTEEENDAAQSFLSNIGWKPGEPLVTLLIRDSAFLQTEPHLTPQSLGLPDDFWAYHRHRNAEIESFLPAVKWLVDQGALVLRMGKSVAQTLEVPGVFDYASSGLRSDFLDVWLLANCSLHITTGTGPDNIAVFADRPVVAIGHTPLAHAITWGKVMTCSKAMYDSEGRRLSLNQHFAANYTRAEEFEKNGITIRDLTPEEICRIVKEAWLCFLGEGIDPRTDQAARRRFFKVVQSSKASSTPVRFHSDARLSTEWLKDLDLERGTTKIMGP